MHLGLLIIMVSKNSDPIISTRRHICKSLFDVAENCRTFSRIAKRSLPYGITGRFLHETKKLMVNVPKGLQSCYPKECTCWSNLFAQARGAMTLSKRRVVGFPSLYKCTMCLIAVHFFFKKDDNYYTYFCIFLKAETGGKNGKNTCVFRYCFFT